MLHTSFFLLHMPFCVSLVTLFQPHLLDTCCVPLWGQNFGFHIIILSQGQMGYPEGGQGEW